MAYCILHFGQYILLVVGDVENDSQGESTTSHMLLHRVKRLTQKCTNEENPQRHIDDRWGDVDEPVWKKRGYPQEDDVID